MTPEDSSDQTLSNIPIPPIMSIVSTNFSELGLPETTDSVKLVQIPPDRLTRVRHTAITRATTHCEKRNSRNSSRKVLCGTLMSLQGEACRQPFLAD